MERLDIGGRLVARGDSVWTRALFWRSVWSAVIKQRYGQGAGYEGQARLLVVRRTRRRWRCMTPSCANEIARGQLHGSSTFGHYCPSRVIADEPATAFRSDWSSGH